MNTDKLEIKTKTKPFIILAVLRWSV